MVAYVFHVVKCKLMCLNDKKKDSSQIPFKVIQIVQTVEPRWLPLINNAKIETKL